MLFIRSLSGSAQEKFDGLVAELPACDKEAIQQHDAAWLAKELGKAGVFKSTERGTAWGKPSVGRVDNTAHETLAEGEFNRFYMRGLCQYSIEHDVLELEIYRAKEVAQERIASHAKLGTRFSPQNLLKDLMAPFGTHTESGLPSGPNSGLSLRIPC